MPTVSFGDKYEHFLAYFGLGFLVHLEIKYQKRFLVLRKYAATVSVLICAAYGAFDEMHQYFIPGRYMDIQDWHADVIGGFLGAMVVEVIFYCYRFFNPELSNKTK